MKSKITLFAAVLAVTGVIAGSTAYAMNGNAQKAHESNAYVAEQCKNGNWEKLGFKNQGQCVSHFKKNS